MCGIAGIIDFDKVSSDPSHIRRMTDAMPHRGPDAVGFFSDANVSLGHLRLSIIDLSSAANQPFPDHSGRYMMVFNGEIYNFQEVKALIPDYPFRTNGDSEVLIAAYIRWGPACLQYFKGMFAFAIWDTQEKELFLARDRMGVKPLYYHQEGGRTIFASEIRGILATGLVKRKLSNAALLEYFTYQSVSSPWSPVEGIRQLAAGAWMKVKRSGVEKNTWWQLPPENPVVGGPEGTHQHIRQLLLRSIERRLVSDVPVGAFLSGGIDSSAVVALMTEAGTSRPNTFNIAFEEEEYDESGYAETVARKFNTEHTRILLKPTAFLDELKNALDSMDTPSGDGINTYVVSKAIRQKGITVALSGIGGDELFAGYPFFGQYLRMQDHRNIWRLPAPVRQALGLLLSPGGDGGRLSRIRQLLELPGPGIEQAYPVFRQVLSPALLDSLTTLDVNGCAETAVQQLLKEKRQGLAAMPLLSQVSIADYLGYTQHTLLKDTDQMSMAVSLEVREPFFDHDLVEYVLSIPDAVKKPVYPKSLLVESLRPLLPDEIVHRKKRGFLFPWNQWLKNELREFCDRHIANIAQRPFIKAQPLLDYWRRFLSGEKNTRWAEIWLFVVLEYWLETNDIS